MWVTEYQMTSCVVEGLREREETYTTFERVPEKRVIKHERCYLKPEIKQQEVTTKRCAVVNLPVRSKKKVKVPVTDAEYTDDLCTKCGVNCSCEKTFLAEIEEEEAKTQRAVVFEKTTRQVDYCRLTPDKEVVEYSKDTVYTLKPVPKTRTVTACVKELVRNPVEVSVCKQVCKEVTICEVCAGKQDAKERANPSRLSPPPKHTKKTHIQKLREKLGLPSLKEQLGHRP